MFFLNSAEKLLVARLGGELFCHGGGMAKNVSPERRNELSLKALYADYKFCLVKVRLTCVNDGCIKASRSFSVG